MPSASLSEASICNLALGLVGQTQFVDSLDEATKAAEVAKTYFAATRDELLAAYRWRFATKRQALAPTLQVRAGWTYAYAAPADMLVPQCIWPGMRNPGRGEEVPFAVELNDAADGQLILTDWEDAELKYTVALTRVALFPPYFVAALAAQLAVYFAGALPVKPQLMPGLQSAAQLKLQTAAAIDANQATRDEEAESEFIRAREG